MKKIFIDRYHVWPYIDYADFINECKNKSYDENLVLHKHHIIPQFIDKSKNNMEIVLLSVEDHITAHLLLAKCTNEGTYEYISNIRSANILNRYSIKDKDVLKQFAETYKGENNPFYGKKHTQETKNLIASKTSENFKDKSYIDRYGDNAEKEKEKRRKGVKNYWDNITEEEKQQRSLNMSKGLKGKTPWNKGLKNDPRLVKYVKIYIITTPENEELEFKGKKLLSQYLSNLNKIIEDKNLKINKKNELLKFGFSNGYKLKVFNVYKNGKKNI